MNPEHGDSNNLSLYVNFYIVKGCTSVDKGWRRPKFTRKGNGDGCYYRWGTICFACWTLNRQISATEFWVSHLVCKLTRILLISIEGVLTLTFRSMDKGSGCSLNSCNSCAYNNFISSSCSKQFQTKNFSYSVLSCTLSMIFLHTGKL